MDPDLEFSLGEFFQQHRSPEQAFVDHLDDVTRLARPQQPDADGYWYFLALRDLKMRMQRPDGSVSEEFNLNEGDIFATDYPVQTLNRLPLIRMGNAAVAQRRETEIKGLRLFYQLEEHVRRSTR